MLREVVSNEIRRWQRCVRQMAAGHGGPDAVHRWRTTSRRCREAMRLAGFKNEELAHFSHALGSARDVEMLCQLLDQRKDLRPEEQRVLMHLEVRRRKLRRTIERRLRLPAAKRLGEFLQKSMHEITPVHTDDHKVSRKALRKAYHRLQKLWKKRPKHPGKAYLHPLRRGIRRLRYVAELTIPVAGKRTKRLAKKAARWQRLLGDYQDALIAQRLLMTVKGAGRLIKKYKEREKDTEQQFWEKWQPRGWRKLERQCLRALK